MKKYLLIAIIAASVIMIAAATPSKQVSTVYYFDADLDKVGRWVCKWAALGYEIKYITPQTVAVAGGYYDRNGSIFVVMQK